jgi:DNA-binding PadR family transcriptional regulator
MRIVHEERRLLAPPPLTGGDKLTNRRKLFERWVKSLAPLLTLVALRTREMTGYDLIKFIYENFGVLLSAGTIYPILHSLQAHGMVTDRVQGTKRVYAISEEGKCTLRDLHLPFVRGQSVLMSFLKYEDELASDPELPQKTSPDPDVTATQTIDRAFSPDLNDAGQIVLTQSSAVPDLRPVAVEPEQVLDYVKNLQSHDHAVLFYENLEEKWRVIFNHLQCALENGKPAVYICRHEEPAQVHEALRRLGIDVLGHESHGRFRILQLGDCSKDEEINQIGTGLETVYQQLMKENKTIRVALDATFAIKELQLEKILKYEQLIGRAFTLPIAGICAYNAQAVAEASDELLRELVKLHGHVIFPGIALRL